MKRKHSCLATSFFLKFLDLLRNETDYLCIFHNTVITHQMTKQTRKEISHIPVLIRFLHGDIVCVCVLQSYFHPFSRKYCNMEGLVPRSGPSLVQR